ncbi:TrmH family RNA methyltransferase [Salinisphaera sp. PC39]|uniref:23S rRNA (guanosine(2251)-2'-O)-methyltransferase RlmB n=1 Tax=Salinisphaera sp. PC39 TaxID=1304156 RepID=UPI00334208AB
MSESVPIAGWHAVTAALAAGRPVERVLMRDGRDDARARGLRERAELAGVPMASVPAGELDDLSPDVDHQGVVALVAPAEPLDEAALDGLLAAVDAPLVLALDGVQDPHNLGACLRSAAAAGVTAVIVPKDRAAGLTPAARKVAAGGAEVVPLVRVTNLARTLKRLQADGLWVVGTAADAPATIHAVDLKGPLVLVLGGEGGGMRRLTRETCDLLAAIPMAGGGVASLNVSVATGVCLFEALRQRGTG